MPLEKRLSQDGFPIITFKDVRAGFEQWLLITSDRHWDNPKSNLARQKRDLELARERNARVIDLGDFFCLMQGKYDPRSSKGDIRPEHQNGEYLDSVISTAVEWFAPYADLFDLIMMGNHESNILKRHETNITRRFVDRLNAEAGSDITPGGMRSWLRWQFFRPPRSTLGSTNFYLHHGFGGGGIVTKGTLNATRMMAYAPSAHVIAHGHIHETWHLPIMQTTLNDHANEVKKKVDVICAPPYKEEFFDADGGYHHEKGRPPKPTGCVWIRFFSKGGQRVEREVTLDLD